MANTITPRAKLTKIEVNANKDAWGDLINANTDIIDPLLVPIEFVAYLTASINNFDGDGQDRIVPFDAAYVNVGNYFSPSTHLFSVPSNGILRGEIGLNMNGTPIVTRRAAIFCSVSGGQYVESVTAPSSGMTNFTIDRPFLIKVVAGETIGVHSQNVDTNGRSTTLYGLSSGRAQTSFWHGVFIPDPS